jgi:thiosulfate/3-mercaptopyruvate sulfurtransferase
MVVAPVNERGYARPELLAETHWLAGNLENPRLRIIDTRAEPVYNEGHIPGAAALVKAGGIPRAENGEMVGPDEFAAIMGKLGISNDTTVVVYDAPGAAMGMLAWSLIYYGHRDVRMLDGGFAKWTVEGRPVSTEPSSYPQATFEAEPVEELYCSLDHAKETLGRAGTVFWDTRTPAEYEGKAPTGPNAPARLGHLPGAVHLEWIELLDPETRTFKPAGELRTLLESRGITPESEIDCY